MQWNRAIPPACGISRRPVVSIVSGPTVSRLVRQLNQLLPILLLVLHVGCTSDVDRRARYVGRNHVTLGGGVHEGDPASATTLVIFSDYQCPACAELADTATILKAELVGKLRVVHKSFPLMRIHPQAFIAAVAARCSAASGHFHALHTLLFQYQDQIAAPMLVSVAREAGVQNLSEFQACLRSPAESSAVHGDLRDARELGLPGTPAVILNDTLQPFGMPIGQLARRVREAAGAGVSR